MDVRVSFDRNEYVRFRLGGIRIPWTGGQAGTLDLENVRFSSCAGALHDLHEHRGLPTGGL